ASSRLATGMCFRARISRREGAGLPIRIWGDDSEHRRRRQRLEPGICNRGMRCIGKPKCRCAIRADSAWRRGAGGSGYEAARRWFESLPAPERRAIQDALVWTGDYNGTNDGNFGKRTRDAIAAFAVRVKKPA